MLEGVDSRAVIVLGRGHSGTRAIAELVARAGVKMGEPQNGSNDYVPVPNQMYALARLAGARAKVLPARSGPHAALQMWDRFDFTELVEGPIPDEAIELLRLYIGPAYAESGWWGWKLPETILAYPWIVRLMPRARFIWWLRDPRDCILKKHGTDDLHTWGVQGLSCRATREQRAVSWVYQAEIVRRTPKPTHLLRLTFDEWARGQTGVLEQLRDFLPGSNPKPLEVKHGAVERWKKEGHDYDPQTLAILDSSLRHFGWLPAT